MLSRLDHPPTPLFWLFNTQEIKSDVRKAKGSKVRIQRTDGGRFELEAAGESSVLQTLSIQSRQVTWSPSRLNVLYCRLTEAIIPVAHHYPQLPTTVSGPAQPS